MSAIRLVTLAPSTVVHACKVFTPEQVKAGMLETLCGKSPHADALPIRMGEPALVNCHSCLRARAFRWLGVDTAVADASDAVTVTKRKPPRIVIDIVNRDGRIIAQSATGRGAVTWTMQSAAIVKAGNYLRARVLADTESPMEVDRK